MSINGHPLITSSFVGEVESDEKMTNVVRYRKFRILEDKEGGSIWNSVKHEDEINYSYQFVPNQDRQILLILEFNSVKVNKISNRQLVWDK